MRPRLPSQGFSSFLTFYSCSRPNPPPATRFLPPILPQCRRHHNSRRTFERVGDRRLLHATHPRSASQKNPYEVLGVKSDATPAEIKKTYFALARKYHPDTNPDKGAQDKFVEIQEAYDTLKDEKKRAAYDQYGSFSQQPGFDPDAYGKTAGGFSAGGFSGFQDFTSAFSKKGHGPDIFDQLFGSFGARQSRGPEIARGANIETTIQITFMDACKGTKKIVNVSPITDCKTCSGTGLKSGAKRKTCTACGGSGARTFVVDGGFQMASTCNVCMGEGNSIPHNSECQTCGGLGKVKTTKTVPVSIPAGVEDGMSIRVPNAGDAPLSGKGHAGDLLVRVRVTPSKHFQRQGANLFHEARIPMHAALLGGKVRVPTLDGDVDVRVPGGTQPGEEMILKGRGVPSVYGGDNGDLYVTFSVVLPRSLTRRQRELLQQYADDVEGRFQSSSLKGSPQGSEEASSGDHNVDEKTTCEDDQEAEKKRATG